MRTYYMILYGLVFLPVLILILIIEIKKLRRQNHAS
jgi:hypothetical protein